MSDETTSTPRRSEEMVDCAVCGESIPRNHTIVSRSVGRICHFCHRDEQVGPDWEDEDDWDDGDWDDLD